MVKVKFCGIEYTWSETQFKGPPNWAESAMSKVSSEKLRSYLKELTREPHIAGQVSEIRKKNEIEMSKTSSM